MAASSEECLLVKPEDPSLKLPHRKTPGSAGYDLCAGEDKEIPARGKAIISTRLQIAIPPGTYGRVAPRSGLAAKHSLDVGAGVIDSDYRGTVGVILFNHSDVSYKVNKGDRIAQLILERIATPRVRMVDELPDTERGSGGFGSTGK